MSKSTVLEEVEIPLGGQRADVLAHRPGVPRRRYVQRRLALQGGLDAEKEQAERNRMGQFATPTGLAVDILRYAKAYLGTRAGSWWRGQRLSRRICRKRFWTGQRRCSES